MFPAIWPGDFVTVQRCELAELRPGQVVVYHQEEKLIVHRLERVTGDRLMTRGDSRLRFDAPLLPGAIVGRVVSISRGRRTINPQQTFWQRVASPILRRSDFLVRVALYLSRRLWNTGEMQSDDLQTPRASASPVPAARL